jgi:glycosyltransferase involved in cell wall biosynthesis
LGIELAVELENGHELVHELGTIDVCSQPPPGTDHSGAAIAICMATHDPDPRLLSRQIESLRAQTETDWICLIRDDGSDGRRFAELTAIVAGDERFKVARGERPLGPYRNFERVLSQLPAGPSLVALCDQDDRWHPEKLSVLRQQLRDAQLAYSDQRVVDRDGTVLSPTMWRERRNQWRDLASLVIANTVTGSAALMRREVVELALPFPEVPGLQLHDHWLATVALATGKLRYTSRPLSDYVQHADAVLGRVRAGTDVPARPDARAAYFYGFAPRQLVAQALLARGGARISPRKRRSLMLLIASSRSPWAFAWLLVRGLLRTRQNLGSEFELARGIAWLALIPLRARRPIVSGRPAFDASCPAPTPETLGRGRLARWRANL